MRRRVQKKSASIRLSVVDKNMQPLCRLQDQFYGVAHVAEKACPVRALRNTQGGACDARARAAARPTDLPLSLARAAGSDAIGKLGFRRVSLLTTAAHRGCTRSTDNREHFSLASQADLCGPQSVRLLAVTS